MDGQEVATFTTSSLAQGSHSVTAAYSGDTSFDASTSDSLSQQINAETTTTLTGSPNPATVGDSVTFTAVVATTGSGTPGGTVTFTIDGQAQDPVDLAIVDGEDLATFTTSSLAQAAIPSLPLIAVMIASTLAPLDSLSERIKAATTTNLTASAEPRDGGRRVTFTATIATTGTGSPGGKVTFRIDGQAQDPVDLAVVDGQDVATFTTSTLAQGNHSVTATYSGDSNFDASTSDSLTEQINSATATATTTTLSASANPTTVGNSVTFTAVVNTTGDGVPSGSVVFSIDGQAQDPVALQVVDGQDLAAFTISSLTQGSHSVTAAYSGDDDFSTSASDTLTEQINATTTTTLTSSANPATVGDSVTFMAVVATTGTGTPGGTVTFTIDGQAQDPVNLAVVDGQDVAVFTTSSLALKVAMRSPPRIAQRGASTPVPRIR